MPFNLLSNQEVEALHQATLRILDETGIAAERAGQPRRCWPRPGRAWAEGRVCLPPDLVEGCIAQAGKQVTLRGRGGTVKTLGDGRLYFHNLGGARDIYDAGSGKRRPAAGAGCARRHPPAGCAGELPHHHPLLHPHRCAGEHHVAGHVPPRPAAHRSSRCRGRACSIAAEVRYAVRMAEVIGQPAEVLTLALSPVSPLTIPDHEALAILEIARLGIGFAPLPCPTAGTTAPFSIAGAVAQQNAEVLAALVLAAAGPPRPADHLLRAAGDDGAAHRASRCGAAWSWALASAGTVQIGHRYGLPVNVYGFSTNAHTLDVQNGFERALNAALPGPGRRRRAFRHRRDGSRRDGLLRPDGGRQRVRRQHPAPAPGRRRR